MFLFKHIQRAYINQLATRFRNFGWKQPDLASFSCPYCGDSKKDKLKARGYLYLSTPQSFSFHCHNCNISRSFRRFLQEQSEDLFKQYRLELLRDRMGAQTQSSSPPSTSASERPMFDPVPAWRTGLTPIYKLDIDHPARTFLEKRLLPIDLLYYAENFSAYVIGICPEYKDRLKGSEGRIIIPLLTASGSLIGVQGRSLNPETKQRYISIHANHEEPMIFGQDRLTPGSEPSFITEGPFDSLFLPNAIAVTGSALNRVMFRTSVYIWDNEPRAEPILIQMQGALTQQKKIFIWPQETLGIAKDINELVVARPELRDQKTLAQFINNNSYSGAKAALNFSKWKRIDGWQKKPITTTPHITINP